MTEEAGRIAVIGAGPAGMAAAIRAARAGASVTLFERNDKVGRKLAITGKGRCNVTNDCPADEFFSHVLRGEKFLYSSIYRFPPRSTVDFFENAGVPLKTERGNRVFPRSDRAYDVVDALLSELRRAGVRLLTGVRVTAVERCDGGFAVAAGSKRSVYRAVIVATGGVTYPLTGSTGDGYEFARAAGVPVVDPLPSLVPVETEEDVSALSGLTLKNVTLSVLLDGKTVCSRMGEMLFAHFGVTGPLVLSATANMRERPAAEYRFSVDMKPAIPREELDGRLVGMIGKSPGKDLINALRGIAPAAMIPYIIRQAGVGEHKRAGDVTRVERLSLVSALKEFRLTPTSFRPIDEAIVTAGGVDLRAVGPKTMEARSVPGLFFAGEVLDADAYTGGFNLQIAFSTGVAAGDAAAKYCE